MDHIVIKEEIEDNYDAGRESYSSSSSTSYRTQISSSLSPSISSTTVLPTQRLIPSTLLASRQGLNTVGSVRYYAGDIFHKEPSLISKSSGLKRKGAELDPSRSKHARSQPPLISPPRVPTGPSFHSHNTNSNLPKYPDTHRMEPAYHKIGE